MFRGGEGRGGGLSGYLEFCGCLNGLLCFCHNIIPVVIMRIGIIPGWVSRVGCAGTRVLVLYCTMGYQPGNDNPLGEPQRQRLGLD